MGGGRPNRKSHAMTSAEIFENRDFLWDKEGKIRSLGSDLAHNQNFAKGEGLKLQVKNFYKYIKRGDTVSKLLQLKCITDMA